VIELQMIEPYRADMLAFFEELAQGAAAGWNGDNGWESEFSQLHLAATSDGEGEVTIRIFVRWAPNYDDERRGELSMRATDVERFGERMRKFLRLEHGDRFSGSGRRGNA
jgi:hypothetical protein